jgi:glutamate--cysteine ligase
MRGLLYDVDARTAAIALTAKLTIGERERVADEVPARGFATRIGDHSVGELARELVAIARAGLTRLAPGSVPLLEPIEAIAASGRTHADHIVDLWRTHAGDRAALLRALAHPGLDGLKLAGS